MANPFYFEGGLSASNTHELEAILKDAEPGQYQAHVEQNNFAAWIRHELDNDLLAQRLEQCRTIQQVIDILHIEHAAKKRSETKPKREQIRDLRPTRHKQEPPKPVSEKKPEPPMGVPETQPEPKSELVTKPELPGQKPAKPEPITQEGLLDRYNAKEFVIGLCIGIVLGVLIYALIIALS